MAEVSAASNPSIRGAVVFAWAFGFVLVCALFLASCAAPVTPVVEAPRSPAHLVVINQTDYEWHMIIGHESGPPVRDFRLQARASLTVDLPAGDYSIEQTALSENATPELSRKISSRLESGQTYRWRLATLLSESPGNSDSR